MAIDPRTGQTIIDPQQLDPLASQLLQRAAQPAPNVPGGFLGPIAITAAGLYRERKAEERERMRQDALAREMESTFSALDGADYNDPRKMTALGMRMMSSSSPLAQRLGTEFINRALTAPDRQAAAAEAQRKAALEERRVRATEAGVRTFDQDKALRLAGRSINSQSVTVQPGGASASPIVTASELAARFPKSRAVQILADQDPNQMLHITTDSKGQSKIAAFSPDGDTEAEGKSRKFAKNVLAANKALLDLPPEALMPTVSEKAAGLLGDDARNLAMSPLRQQGEAVKRALGEPILRDRTGAVISGIEWNDVDRTYFPQIGDKPDTIKLKAQLRNAMVEAMLEGAPVDDRVKMLREHAVAVAGKPGNDAEDAPDPANPLQNLPPGFVLDKAQ